MIDGPSRKSLNTDGRHILFPQVNGRWCGFGAEKEPFKSRNPILPNNTAGKQSKAIYCLHPSSSRAARAGTSSKQATLSARAMRDRKGKVAFIRGETYSRVIS
jgi:hypothetical protein